MSDTTDKIYPQPFTASSNISARATHVDNVENMVSKVKKEKIHAPRGVPDYLPPIAEKMNTIRQIFLEEGTKAGYGPVELPIFEHTELFLRAVGESTDVVNKEMYTFLDKGDRSITLRPEGTAGVMRAIIEHGLDKGPLPIKLVYSGPMFRYENPQSGRLRQFQTVGIEAVGVDDPLLDAETIAIAHRGLQRLNMHDYTIEINSLGDRESRIHYRQKLTDFLAKLNLDAPTKQRAEINPLRVLDDKRPEIQILTQDAPILLDFLTEESREHFELLQAGLSTLNIPYRINPRLVRGLDYYNKTTFEFVHNTFGNGLVLGGGGRYDSLSSQLGGAELSGVGFGLGLERILLAVNQISSSEESTSRSDIFMVPLGLAAKKYCLGLMDQLRQTGIRVDMAYGDRTVKNSMKAADRSGARYAILVGERELEEARIMLKNLSTGEQKTLELADLISILRDLLEIAP